jgi:hypothetical protein
LRVKLGAALEKQHIAPHIYENADEAEAGFARRDPDGNHQSAG